LVGWRLAELGYFWCSSNKEGLNMEFKWYLSLDIKDENYDHALSTLHNAQDNFFAAFEASETEYDVLDSELK